MAPPVDQTPPWPSNIVPQPGMGGAKQVDVDEPFRFSLRSLEKDVDLGTLYTSLGYGVSVYVPTSDGLLPEQKLMSDTHEVVLEGFDDWSGPTATEEATRVLSLVVPPNSLAGTHYLEMYKASTNPGKSFYVSSEVLDYHEGFQAEFLLYQPIAIGASSTGPRPYFNEASYSGLMVGAVHGPSNRGVFVFFCDDGAPPLPDPTAGQHIVVTGPAVDGSGNRTILADVYQPWWDPTAPIPVAGEYVPTVGIKISWNLSPGRNVVEVLLGYPNRLPVFPGEVLASIPITSVGTLGAGARLGGHKPSDTLRAFTVYGTESAAALGQSVLQSMGLYPIARDSISAGVGHNNAIATVHPTELVRMDTTGDPREAAISPWVDGMVTGTVVSSGSDLTIRKGESDHQTMPAFLARTEPRMGEGVNRAASWCLYARLLAEDAYFPGSNSTGMGIAVNDSVRFIHLALLSDFSDNFLGLLLGDPALGPVDPKMETNYERLPDTDWSGEVTIQLVAHITRGVLDVYVGDDNVTPVATIAMDTLTWPKGTASEPGLLVGHILPQYAPSGTRGDLVIRELWYTDGLDGYESRWGALPALPVWTWYEAPAATVSASLVDETLYIDGGKGVGLYVSPIPAMQPEQSAMVEWRSRITDWEDTIGSPNPIGEPVYAGVLFDNVEDLVEVVHTLNAQGQYLVYIPAADQGATLLEVLAQTAAGRARSYEVDWMEDHTYRLEYKPGHWVRLYVDNAVTPAIDLDWEDRDLPSIVSPVGVPVVAFGKADAERPSRVGLKFVRYNTSTGYDLAVRRQMPQEEMDTVFGGGANVFVEVSD